MSFKPPMIFPYPRLVSWDENRFLEYRGTPDIRYHFDSGIPSEGYILDVGPDGVNVRNSGPAGAFYAGVTLKQLTLQCGGKIPCVRIEDAPDYPVRGVLLDIGRNKIPTMESLYGLIDMLAELKINQLHLYMEGYCFEYQAHRENFPEETPITAKEYRLLDVYARERFIELVPTQNCFGHMSPWLVLDAYKELAANPEGFELIPGLRNPPSVLNPLDPASLRLVTGLLDELLPNFTSPRVNICSDEPFELGSGKSSAVCAGLDSAVCAGLDSAVCAEKGVGRVYLEFLKKVCSVTARHGRRPMIWGDIITKHPELLNELPRDITILDWNYEGALSFDAHCRLLEEHGLEYYVCPGTSGWCSIAGRVSNMRANLLDAAEQGARHGAGGFLVTDWGDMGHWQVPAVSWPGYVYGAALSWNMAGNRDADIARYLDTFVFRDQAGVMGNMALALGDYSLHEGMYVPNVTLTFGLLALVGLCGREEMGGFIQGYLTAAGGEAGDGKGPVEQPPAEASPGPALPPDFLPAFDIAGLRGLLARSEEQLDRARMGRGDAALIAEEYRNTIRLISHGADLMTYIITEEHLAREEKEGMLRRMSAELVEFIDGFERLWRGRNREGGLGRSTRRFHQLLGQYADRLARL